MVRYPSEVTTRLASGQGAKGKHEQDHPFEMSRRCLLGAETLPQSILGCVGDHGTFEKTKAASLGLQSKQNGWVVWPWLSGVKQI